MAHGQMKAYNHGAYLGDYCKFLGTKNQHAFEKKLGLFLEELKPFGIKVGEVGKVSKAIVAPPIDVSKYEDKIKELEGVILKNKEDLEVLDPPKPQSKAGKRLKIANIELRKENAELKILLAKK
jgi:hypothetical protein